MEPTVVNHTLGLYGLSSAICCHLLSRRHYGVVESWYANKWFWLGLIGNLPALVAFVAHMFLSRKATSPTSP
jgi:hypothetical protein